MLEEKIDELIQALNYIGDELSERDRGEMYRNTPADSLEAISITMENILEALQNIDSKLK